MVFVVDGYPQRPCVSIHEITNFTGLLRSEMMLVIGMMLGRMERQDSFEQDVSPVRGSVSFLHNRLLTVSVV